MEGFAKGRQGFDVSFWQDDDTTPQKIDFTKMVAWGADFVICRAGQNLWIDEDVKDYWSAAKAAGLPRGSYWFYDPRIDPLKQADLFMGLFVNDKPEGRLWLDLEFPDSWGGAFKSWQDWKKFCEAVRRHYRLGIYTASWWWQPYAVLKGADLAYFGQFPLWVAQYTSDPAFVTLPRGWSRAMIWQDDTPAIGDAVGVESKEVDHNYWNANLDFAAEWGMTPEPPPTGDTMMKYKVVWGIGASRRPEPHTGNTAVGYYSNGEVFDVVQDNIPDQISPNDPGKKWVLGADGYYVASHYPDGTGVSKVRLERVDTPPPAGTFPPEIEVTIGAETRTYVLKG